MVEAHASIEKLQAFATAANAATQTQALTDAMQVTVSEFGIQHFSIVRHVHRMNALTDDVGLSTYPLDWLETVRERGYFADDPVIVACQRSVAGFRWSDLPYLITLTQRQRDVLALAKARGLDRGYTVPLHLPGEISASCSFAATPGRDVTDGFVPAAQWLAAVAFEALRRLSGRGSEAPVAALSERQIDCVVWLCRGKSKAATAQILGISEDTVRFHIKAVMRKWNVASGLQIAAKALQQGIVTYHDVA